MEHINGSKRISEIVEMLEKEISYGGLEAVVGGDCVRCGLAMPREAGDLRILNRYRGFENLGRAPSREPARPQTPNRARLENMGNVRLGHGDNMRYQIY